jgi:hypothetical protein
MKVLKMGVKGGASFFLSLSLCLILAGCSGSAYVETQVKEPVDTAIAVSVNSALRADPALRNFNIQVEVEGGVVTLWGEVNNRANQEKALSLAKQVEGVKEVRNELKINPNLSGESLTP